MAMRIEPHTIRLAELFEGYRNDGENGAVAYGGRLICRPPYQREFVYKPKQQEEVVNTILKGFPLNSIYWIVNDDGTFELLDGQQRTLSICEYMDGAFLQIFVGTSSPTETSGTRIVVDSLGTTKCRYISVPMVQTRKTGVV